MDKTDFADWALKRVPQGEFRANYYKLLKIWLTQDKKEQKQKEK